jgi:hypothetical protein
VFELIGLIATGAATAGGYSQSRGFVRRRLKYVDLVQSAGAPVIAGAAAAVVAAPVVALLPLVGAGTALLFGAGVGAGVAAGAKDIRRRLPSGM